MYLSRKPSGRAASHLNRHRAPGNLGLEGSWVAFQRGSDSGIAKFFIVDGVCTILTVAIITVQGVPKALTVQFQATRIFAIAFFVFVTPACR